ncbi:MAG: rRNA maturation RNase YbeY [Patescibacteria group bacterium]
MLSAATITKYKNAVLGRRFDLSVAYVTPAKMKVLNRAHRKINKATDILSFPLSKNSGEIIMCKSEVASHAKEWGMAAAQYLPFLVIHGMLHLRGLDHGRIMESEERKYCRRFGLVHPRDSEKTNGRTDRSGNRRRHAQRARRRRAR